MNTKGRRVAAHSQAVGLGSYVGGTRGYAGRGKVKGVVKKNTVKQSNCSRAT